MTYTTTSFLPSTPIAARHSGLRLARLLLAAAAVRAPRGLAQVELPPITVEAPRVPPARDETPTVTAIVPEALEAAGVLSTRDLSAFAPDLIVQEGGSRTSAFIGIRGLSNAAALGDTSVGLYVDGVPYVDQRGALVDLYDIEGVQVFRGPQTTTFGRNAESGTMSIFTPVPGNDLRARGVVWLGTHDEQVYQASAAGPWCGTRRSSASRPSRAAATASSGIPSSTTTLTIATSSAGGVGSCSGRSRASTWS